MVGFFVTNYRYCTGAAGLACGRRPSESDVYGIQMERKDRRRAQHFCIVDRGIVLAVRQRACDLDALNSTRSWALFDILSFLDARYNYFVLYLVLPVARGVVEYIPAILFSDYNS